MSIIFCNWLCFSKNVLNKPTVLKILKYCTMLHFSTALEPYHNIFIMQLPPFITQFSYTINFHDNLILLNWLNVYVYEIHIYTCITESRILQLNISFQHTHTTQHTLTLYDLVSHSICSIAQISYPPPISSYSYKPPRILCDVTNLMRPPHLTKANLLYVLLCPYCNASSHFRVIISCLEISCLSIVHSTITLLGDG